MHKYPGFDLCWIPVFFFPLRLYYNTKCITIPRRLRPGPEAGLCPGKRPHCGSMLSEQNK